MKFFCTLFFAGILNMLAAQQVGIGTNTPHPSAALEVASPNKGVLLPSISKETRLAIENPANGLLVYQNGPDSTGFYFFNGTNWDWMVSNQNNNSWKLGGNEISDPESQFIGPLNNDLFLVKAKNQMIGQLHLVKNSVFWGKPAGNLTHTGSHNIGLGPFTLTKLTTGSQNIAIGLSSLNSNTTGLTNTAIGLGALSTNTSGSNNVGLGWYALEYNTEGNDNIAIGSLAGRFNSTAFHNISIGSRAGLANRTGTGNVAIGAWSLTNGENGSQNTAVGDYAMNRNGLGVAAGNPIGKENTALGNRALFDNRTGIQNFGGGAFALYNNLSGSNNTAIGFNSAKGLVDGSNNIAIGALTTFVNASTQNAVIVGSNATANCNNCIILGSINGVNSATASHSVGIGTNAPFGKLQVSVTGTSTVSGSNNAVIIENNGLGGVGMHFKTMGASTNLWQLILDAEGRFKMGRENVADYFRIMPNGVVQIPVGIEENPLIAPALNAPWINYGDGFANAGFHKNKLGQVFLQGLVRNGNNTLIFTLPAGHRPTATQIFTAVSNAPSGFSRVDILTNGEVRISGAIPTYVSLDGINFRAGN